MALIDGPACGLWIETLGAGDPVTLLVHGLGSSSEDLRPLASGLPGTRVLLDLRGHGRSGSPEDPTVYGCDAMADDVARAADAADATCALGVSLGSEAVLHLLARVPDRFARVALVSPSRLDGGAPDPAGARSFAASLEERARSEVTEGILALPSVRALVARDERWEPQIRAQLARMNATGVPRAHRAYAAGPPPVPDPSVLGRVTARTLVAAHTEDPNHPLAVAQAIATAIPGAALRVWDGAFSMMLDDLDALAVAVADLLTGDDA